MRIGIDCRMLGARHGGLGRYVEQLVSHLRHTTTDTLVLFLTSENWDLVSAGERVEKVRADIPWYGWKEQLLLPNILRAAQLDVMHFPHWNVPFLYRGPFVLTVHDLIMYHYARPEATTLGPVVFAIKDWVHRRVLTSAVKRSRAILTTSEFTKQDIITTLHTPAEKIVVTYQAPYEQVTPSGGKEQLFGRLGITQDYALYVGSAYPHKNLEGLMKAWDIFEEQYGKEFQLVLVGKMTPFYERVRAQVPAGTHIVFTDFLTDAELEHLYAGARAFVFPSLYEGFGLPPLEAMARNIPVLSSSTACMPEVLGEGVMYMDPTDTPSFAAAVHSILTNDDLRAELRYNAKQELTRYSWKQLAAQTQSVYKNVL